MTFFPQITIEPMQPPAAGRSPSYLWSFILNWADNNGYSTDSSVGTHRIGLGIVFTPSSWQTNRQLPAYVEQKLASLGGGVA